MNEVRFHGGPWHRKVRAIQDRHQPIEVLKPTKHLTMALYTSQYVSADLAVHDRGRYWPTGEMDSKGRRIYAWTGWKRG